MDLRLEAQGGDNAQKSIVTGLLALKIRLLSG
jgi:hypothetical protein